MSRRGSISTHHPGPASNIASRAREREAEFAKAVTDRDQQITKLKERLKALSKRLEELSKEQKAVQGRVNAGSTTSLASSLGGGSSGQGGSTTASLLAGAMESGGVELQSIIKQVNIKTYSRKGPNYGISRLY